MTNCVIFIDSANISQAPRHMPRVALHQFVRKCSLDSLFTCVDRGKLEGWKRDKIEAKMKKKHKAKKWNKCRARQSQTKVLFKTELSGVKIRSCTLSNVCSGLQACYVIDSFETWTDRLYEICHIQPIKLININMTWHHTVAKYYCISRSLRVNPLISLTIEERYFCFCSSEVHISFAKSSLLTFN